MVLRTNTKDQLGVEDTVDQQGVWDYAESLSIIQCPVIVSLLDYSSAFTLGDVTKGVLGNTTYKLGGLPGTETLQRVMNYNNTYVERFRNLYLVDTSATTATVSTTTFTVTFTSSQVFQTLAIAKNGTTVYSKILFTARFSTGSYSNVTVQAQFNGTNWETITPGVEYATAYPSSTGIKLKITASASVVMNVMRVVYS